MTAREALEKTFEDLKVHEEEKREEYGENGWEAMPMDYWVWSIYRRWKNVKYHYEHIDPAKSKEELKKILLEASFLYQRFCTCKIEEKARRG